MNGPAISAESSPNLMLYVFNHELLHALGFEHTFDSTDGDFYLSTDPMLGATPHETVMSYRPPEGGSYPSDLSFSDYVSRKRFGALLVLLQMAISPYTGF